jgi:cell division transport system permease protein
MNAADARAMLSWLRQALGMRGLNALGHLAREAGLSLWRSRVVSLFAIGIIALSLATVGGFLLIAQNLQRVLERFGQAEFSLYLADGASGEQLDELKQVVEATPEIVSYTYVTKTQALESFKRMHPALAEAPSLLGSNPFPASYEIRLADASKDPDQIRALAEKLGGLAAVESVGLDDELVRRLGAARSVVSTVGLFFGGILVLACLFTVANVVKLTAYAHRDEIEIMKLVGATIAFVRGTYIIEGLLQGVLGGLTGVGLLWLVHRAATSYLERVSLSFLHSLTSSFISTQLALGLVLGAALLGMVGAALSVGRYVRL